MAISGFRCCLSRRAGYRGLARALPGALRRGIGRGAAAVLLVLLPGCATETLFRSNFDATAVGQPPSVSQAIGTANIDGPAGSVVVVGPPGGATGKWVQITRVNQQPSVSGWQGHFSQFKGAGRYNFSAALFMPTGAGPATIQFEPFGQPVGTYTNFLHIDLMPDNTVRINDNDASKFGMFPRDQVFLVMVAINTEVSPPPARITLAGAGASGQADHVITGPLQTLAQQFGGFRVWMGFPWTGSFSATELVVTRRTD
jgi:hypothetical protein